MIRIPPHLAYWIGDKMKVIFLRTISSAPWQEEIGFIRFVDGKIDFSKVPSSVEEMLESGIMVSGKTFYPTDGLEFMKNLPKAFSGSMFRVRID